MGHHTLSQSKTSRAQSRSKRRLFTPQTLPQAEAHGSHAGRCSGRIITFPTSNSSMNCWSSARGFGRANMRYSAQMDVWLQWRTFRRHPMRHPVRCRPLLQCTNSGCARASNTKPRASAIWERVWLTERRRPQPAMSRFTRDALTTGSGMSTNGSLLPGTPN